MIVECPKCSVKFNIEKAVLAKGVRKVKCSQCQHIWLEGEEKKAVKPPPVKSIPPKAKPKPKPEKIAPIPEAVKPLLNDDILELAEVETEEGKGQKNQEKNTALGIGVLVFLFLLLSTIGGLILGKDKIIQQWSPSILLYETVGLYNVEESNSIRFRNVLSEWKESDAGQFLYIEFEINNIAEHTVDYPNIEVSTKDEKGHIVKSWHPKPKKETLSAGETDKVKLGFRDVDPNGRSVMIKIVK